MKISLAIPIYQQADLLPSALKSIQCQATHIQLSVMDATPDDSVAKVLNNYRDFVYYHRHGEDNGQTAAIQEGWDNTNGEILAWLCADDYYFPDTIDTIREIFINHPEIDVVYGDTVFIDKDESFFGYFPSTHKDIKNIKRECCISQPSCFIRRTAFERIGGRLNEKLHYIMDWDLWTRLYDSGASFYYLRKPLSVVRMNENTKTGSRSWRRFFEIGKHLYKNTSIVHTIRSLVGFYYQDLLLTNATGIEKLALYFLDGYRLIKGKISTSQSVQKSSYYGLSEKNDITEPYIDIYMPWYNALPPATLTIHCNAIFTPIAHLNGVALKSQVTQPCIFDIPQPNCTINLLHLKLSSPIKEPWRLSTVKFIMKA